MGEQPRASEMSHAEILAYMLAEHGQLCDRMMKDMAATMLGMVPYAEEARLQLEKQIEAARMGAIGTAIEDQGDVGRYQARIEGLEERNRKLYKRTGGLVAEVNDLEAEVNRLRAASKPLLGPCSSPLLDTIDSLREYVANQKSKLRESEVEVNRLKAQKAGECVVCAWKTLAEDMKRSVISRKARIKGLEWQLEFANKQVELLKADVRVLEAERDGEGGPMNGSGI